MNKGSKRRRGMSFAARENLSGYLFMTPWLIGFVIFSLLPFLMTIVLSFCNVTSTVTGYSLSYAKMDNYYTAFFRNTEFVPALLEYLWMVIPYTFIIIVVSFILAYLLNKINVGRTMLRIIYFLPIIILSGPVMSQILDSADEAVMLAQGVETSLVEGVFILEVIDSYWPPVAEFLGAIFEQLSMILWFTGIPIVLFISSLQRLNPSMLEAAAIDGANEWQNLWKIIVPNLKPTAMVGTIFTIVQLGTYDTTGIYSLIKTATNNTATGLGYAATYCWIYCIFVLLVIGGAFLIFKERQPRRVER